MALNLLPDLVRWGWAFAFLVVFVLHFAHVLAMRGVHRLWHCGHLFMAAGMAFMFLPAQHYDGEFWMWAAAYGLLALFAAIYGVVLFLRGKAIELPWVTLTAGLAVMAYMWWIMLGSSWGTFTIAAVLWFVLEAVGWFTQELCGHEQNVWLPRGLMRRGSPPDCAFMAGRYPVAHGTSRFGTITLGIMSIGMAYMLMGMHLMM